MAKPSYKSLIDKINPMLHYAALYPHVHTNYSNIIVEGLCDNDTIIRDIKTKTDLYDKRKKKR